jgi:excisionase family DNA binding protein
MEDWITTSEAAQHSGYNAEYIRRLMRNGKLVSRKFGTVWQVSRQSLQAYLRTANQRAKGDKRYRADTPLGAHPDK